MSIWGKIIGGAAGLALGGPIGALLGVGVGAAVDIGIERAAEQDPAATKRIAFTIGVIALAAKMAKADGRVTEQEVRAFKQVFRVPPHEVRNVGRVFDLARQDTAGFEAYARQIADIMKGNRAVLQDLIGALLFIAESDGEIHPNEIIFVETVAEIFGFSAKETEELIHRHTSAEAGNPYAVLGVDPTISDQDLKARWRQLVRETHPDRLMAEGVPPDLIAVANRRAAEINVAYRAIVEKRKSRESASNDAS